MATNTEKAQKQTFTTKLYECCANDELRPMMQCVHFMNGFAYASDGIVMIKQTLELHSVVNKEQLEGKAIHKDSYKVIMTFEIAEATETGVYCKSTSGQTAFFDYFEKLGEKTPNFESMLTRRGLTSLTFIGINPEHFARLAKAIYNPGNNMRMQFTGVSTAILIDCPGVEGQEAIVMPKIINDSLFG